MDRNTSIDNLTQGVFKSLSARRAWIEISPAGCWRDARRVALRKERVDRNSSRFQALSITHVALRKESVDRNFDNWYP